MAISLKGFLIAGICSFLWTAPGKITNMSDKELDELKKAITDQKAAIRKETNSGVVRWCVTYFGLWIIEYGVMLQASGDVNANTVLATG